MSYDSAVKLLLSNEANIKLLSVENFYDQGLLYDGLGYVRASTMQLLLENGLEVESSDSLSFGICHLCNVW